MSLILKFLKEVSVAFHFNAQFFFSSPLGIPYLGSWSVHKLLWCYHNAVIFIRCSYSRRVSHQMGDTRVTNAGLILMAVT